jgi:Ala-tRNA(Pro) deacylase
MLMLTKLREFLDKNGVPYEVGTHRLAVTAQEVAEAQHVKGKEMAKVVMLRSGSDFIMAVLPAPERIDLDRARTAIRRSDLALATEHEFASLFPQCEPGAMPPFGNLYHVPVYVDQTLTRDEYIVFNAGTHLDTVKMKYADFARLVQPKVVAIAA